MVVFPGCSHFRIYSSLRGHLQFVDDEQVRGQDRRDGRKHVCSRISHGELRELPFPCQESPTLDSVGIDHFNMVFFLTDIFQDGLYWPKGPAVAASSVLQPAKAARGGIRSPVQTQHASRIELSLCHEQALIHRQGMIPITVLLVYIWQS